MALTNVEIQFLAAIKGRHESSLTHDETNQVKQLIDDGCLEIVQGYLRATEKSQLLINRI